jgi:hypothetical protein
VQRCCAGAHSRERRIRERWGATMLDNPEKTTKLLAALKAAVPFEVELTEHVVKQLRMDEKHHTVSELSYAGDEGGIVCHIVPPEKREALVVSLTHVRVPRSMPLAAAVVDYQKHRVKKLKKQGRP